MSIRYRVQVTTDDGTKTRFMIEGGWTSCGCVADFFFNFHEVEDVRVQRVRHMGECHRVRGYEAAHPPRQGIPPIAKLLAVYPREG